MDDGVFSWQLRVEGSRSSSFMRPSFPPLLRYGSCAGPMPGFGVRSHLRPSSENKLLLLRYVFLLVNLSGCGRLCFKTSFVYFSSFVPSDFLTLGSGVLFSV
ncbi:unnamed protein product [Cuscuta europaea]|uniref:Uncharacterized protein n=1 Tax=Cuscuta europaea TaxID=41803 RepID=A0A9P0YXR0_CUSEU|nr:unnamed protein product [Cuscuta europaea]